ncbi:hypothetical protein BGZ63DRAFT_348373 [Mariannaea sp. PMI_226]|nr:hypothetical protein BGZ63DRAFT_348373 [Mariannaea sp. PMI_226]
MPRNQARSVPRTRPKKDHKQTSEDVLIIGIDFGTTYSGVAWAYSGEPEDIEIVTSWDSELNNCSDVEKTPTQLYFGDRKNATKWGYFIPPDKKALCWFKLLLLDDADVPPDVSDSTQLDEAQKMRAKINKDPLLQECQFHVVITLPAIWPFYAQQRMKKAAELSGILEERSCGKTTLRFISEPEAAALATIQDLSKRSTTHAGDTIVVCDAGGGTVVCVLFMTDSGLCGGLFLDEEFVKLIKSKVSIGAWNLIGEAEQKRFLNDGWEHGIKPQFENQQRSWLVDLPEDCDNKSGGIKRRRTLELSSDEILSVFTPIITRIRQLVDRQVQAVIKKYKKPPKYIILVGGFGRSRYLFSQLQASFQSTVLQSRGSKPQVPDTLKLLQWTAICRGAVVHGLAQRGLSTKLNIGARVSRLSYGVDFHIPWRPRKHDKQDKTWNEMEHEYVAENQMQWFLLQGDGVDAHECVRQSYYRLLENPSEGIEEEILVSSAIPPPSRRDASVKRLCTIAWNKQIPLESLPTWTNPICKVYHTLEFDIEMSCEGGTVDFNVFHDGKRVAGRNVEVKCI